MRSRPISCFDANWLTYDTKVKLPTIGQLADTAYPYLDSLAVAHGEERRIDAALTSLARRHPSNTIIDFARESEATVRITVASQAGAFSDRQSEISLAVDLDGLVRPQECTLWTTGSDYALHRYQVPAEAAA
ncbi:hypothetical protein GZ998_05605 [Actinomyces sp. 594]|uniref:hypothetical protein n=1 Tax=Actinomyces sp. 594 TaxID=2057793 RepID=UPI001C565D36|nr:hypothetical protein [Actinomyces sp. 594]MBW3068989.1 hypothetical protein [Actinomyces sp. 594]